MSGVRDKLIVAPSPHIHSPRTTRTIMLDVIIALTPALIAATVIFGGRALLLTAVCVASCVVFEWLMCLLLKKDNTIGDLSAIVTGMLLAFNLPAELPCGWRSSAPLCPSLSSKCSSVALGRTSPIPP